VVMAMAGQAFLANASLRLYELEIN